MNDQTQHLRIELQITMLTPRDTILSGNAKKIKE